jgi:hypothetical protein
MEWVVVDIQCVRPKKTKTIRSLDYHIIPHLQYSEGNLPRYSLTGTKYRKIHLLL